MGVGDVGGVPMSMEEIASKAFQRGQEQIAQLLVLQQQLNLKVQLLTNALDIYHFQKYKQENEIAEQKAMRQASGEEAVEDQGAVLSGREKKTDSGQLEKEEEVPEESEEEKKEEPTSIFSGAAQKWHKERVTPFTKRHEEKEAPKEELPLPTKGKKKEGIAHGEEGRGVEKRKPIYASTPHETPAPKGEEEIPEKGEGESFFAEGKTKKTATTEAKAPTKTPSLKGKKKEGKESKGAKETEGKKETKTTQAPQGGKKGAAAASGPTIPSHPDWTGDPLGSVIGMINWLIVEDILPEAYFQLSNFANEANLHNEQANFMQQIQRELQSMAAMSLMTLPASMPQTLSGVEALIKKLWGKLSPLAKLLSQLSGTKGGYLFTKNDPEYGAWQNIQKELEKNFGGQGENGDLPGIMQFAKFMSREYKMVKDSSFHKSDIHGFLHPEITIGGQRITVSLQRLKTIFNYYVHQSPKKITKSGGQITNPYWHYAFNNVGTTGVWHLPLNNLNQAMTSLSNESETDQQNLRTSFFALTTKTNAASDLLTTLAQMMTQVAQNTKTQ